ncbi:MAG: cupredoxin domain-containing protein [Actinomycetota bacterium]
MSTEETVLGRESSGPSRRSFLKAGAGGLAVASGLSGGVLGLATGAGAARGRKIELFINDGELRMVDNAPVYMWRFAKADGAGGRRALPLRPVVLHAKAGELLTVVVHNNLEQAHSFLIADMVDARTGRPFNVHTGKIAPRRSGRVTFRAPRAGIYMYEDGINRPVNRVLGLGGAFIVTPRRGRNRPFEGGPRYHGKPFVWTLQDVDKAWADAASRLRPGQQLRFRNHLRSFDPRYFNINGKGGFQSMEEETVRVVRRMNHAAWISVVNLGLCTHALHWHGNHVFLWSTNNERHHDFLQEKDVVPAIPDTRLGILLPCHRALDAWPRRLGRDEINCFPMHCHAEMSQTAAGGLYPGGMVTDWQLSPAKN